MVLSHVNRDAKWKVPSWGGGGTPGPPFEGETRSWGGPPHERVSCTVVTRPRFSSFAVSQIEERTVYYSVTDWQCTCPTWRHLQEHWLAAWLFRSWFCTDDKSAKTCSWFWQEQKDAGGRACADQFSYHGIRSWDYCPRLHPSSMWKLS